MTRAVRDRILKDANSDFSDHLRNHIHLTNCIHLKNHMHKNSPILNDRSLMRDLVVLQRSRSLKDPSMSPRSWHSPSVVDLLSRRGEEVLGNGRRSVGIERRKEDVRRFSGSSPPLGSVPTSKVAPGEVSRHNDGAGVVSERSSSKSGVREQRRHKREESSGRSLGADLIGGNAEFLLDGNDLARDVDFGNSEMRGKKIKQKGRRRQDDHLKILSQQLDEAPVDNSDVGSSQMHIPGRRTQYDKASEEAEASIRSYCSGLNSVKGRKKSRSARKPRGALASRVSRAQNEMSVASNSFAQVAGHSKYHMEEGEEEYTEQNVTRGPKNGCGIPWNWSRIHHRSKTFLDKAGKSLSCGLSDPKFKKGGPVPQGREFPNMPVMSDHSSSSTRSDAEALPLLFDASGSQEGMDNAAWVHDYSGELGIFADNLLKHEVDSDLASEARSGDQSKFRRHHNGRHQNLTQMYMPRTFRDLVGQNLVAQALSNAVSKRKVGLLYVFYGPHGTGKTSTARIFARALNCQSQEHPRPCGSCDSCIAHAMGRSPNTREIGPVSNFDFQSIMDLLENMTLSQRPTQYRVFIFDDCDTLAPECWSAISKVIDRSPRRVVIVLVSSSLDFLPHIIISRCQKFFFPKLKDADIIYTLQWIAAKEDLEIDKDALKLIASRSDGSLRDAEMTLEQLSLLGQRISVPLVQELVGLISDDKLVDLLDLALSADTVNTVKSLREIMESGVEPLALMSQLATVITDILAVSKEDMEKLRQALKTLSEAEKQLRMSNDRLTWLTAALLQLAPDQQYMLPSSSADTSFIHSPLGLQNAGGKERPRKSNAEHAEMPTTERGLSPQVRKESHQVGSLSNLYHNAKRKGGISMDRRGQYGVGTVPQQAFGVSGDKNSVGRLPGKFQKEVEELWLEVLEKIQINIIKEFMFQEGKLISVSFGAAPTVQLMFSSHMAKSKAEKFRAYILQAFESVLGSPVTIECICEARKDGGADNNIPLVLPASQNRDTSTQAQLLHLGSPGMGRNEIVEIEASPREQKGNEHIDHKSSTMASIPEQRKFAGRSQSQSLVRSKVSLAHVIQQAEGCAQRSGWSKRKAVSIAEKLEQENLRLEPRSRSLLCWRASKVTRRKLSRMKIRTRKPQALLKFVSCGKCLSARSPR
ncbi:hypothetical protein RJ639_034851 [Escallonia herrerae]|uniref:AAA+ ATPase domain-containing protein n=1 Tax=Escallonia herrerae TaxID=1293975 RepID=A0AA88WVR4_9ASTE|nr:hypothetical protein RJ639_034851 [Escallonia herrerae]